MIDVKSPVQAQALVVGEGEYVDEILRNLISYNFYSITVLQPSTSEKSTTCQVIHADPLELICKDPAFFEFFDVIVSADQPRPFELALSDLRWPKNKETNSADLPFIVTRNVANTCKMRCQYCELPINGSKISKFVSLPMDLLPWTDEKRALVASTFKDEFKLKSNQAFQAYLAAGLAFIKLQRSQGSWPGLNDKQTVLDLVEAEDVLKTDITTYVEQFCANGLAAPHESKVILARLLCLDAFKLVTGNGQPINNINLEEVIQIAAVF